VRLNLEMLTKNRAQIIDELKKHNIGVGVHFMPVHQHLYYSETFNLDDKNYPVASATFPRLMSLPIYPGMTDNSIEKVITSVREILNQYKR
jgi:perosamine synthetase